MYPSEIKRKSKIRGERNISIAKQSIKDRILDDTKEPLLNFFGLIILLCLFLFFLSS